MLNNLAVSAGGLNLGGEMGHKKEGGGGGAGPSASSLQLPTKGLGLRGDRYLLCLSLSLGASLLIGEQRD
jgi:hypothetical protein